MDCIAEKKVTLVADGHEFPCNKEKLIAASDYFRAMFSSYFSEKDKDVIKLQGIDGACLQILLEYAETGAYNIPTDGVLALLQTAAMLQFTDVQSACEREVYGLLSCDSCLEIYAVTTSLGISNIARAARTIALWNFCKIITMPKFLQLSFDALVEYISDPSLFTGPNEEWKVWEAIVRWVEEDDIERGTHLKALLCCVDFKRLTTDDISNMLFYSIVSENDEIVQILESIRKFKCEEVSQLNQSSRTELEGIENCESSQVTENKKLQESVCFYMNCLTRREALSPCVVGFKQSQTKQNKKSKNSDDEDDYGASAPRRNLDLVPVIYTFSENSGKISEEFPLSKLCHGPVVCSGYQVCSVGPSVYVLGGEFQYGYGHWNLSLWRYSTATKKWIVENSLPRPRRHFMICVVDSVIYILGGFGRHRVVESSVNAYDSESGEWLSCPDMPHSVSCGAVCAFKGRVMVFTCEMQLLTYYPSMKKWSAVPLRLPSKHGYRAALPWKNYIYLINNCSNKVYKYSPEDRQTVVEFGHFKSPPINVCIVNGKMYNFSHDNSDNHVVEVLDIEEDQVTLGNSIANQKSIEQISYDTEMNMELKRDKETTAVDDILKNREMYQMKVSYEVWRERDDGPHIFTSKYPADSTFSSGCFPLMKL